MYLLMYHKSSSILCEFDEKCYTAITKAACYYMRSTTNVHKAADPTVV
jgi:hypothetical protein